MNDSIRRMSSIIPATRSRRGSGDTDQVLLDSPAERGTKKGVVLDQVHSAPGDGLQSFLKTSQGQERHRPARVELDQNVNVAPGSIVAAGDGTENRDRCHAELAPEVRHGAAEP